MSDVGQIERRTQNRVVQLFTDVLGYTYLGNWERRDDVGNIEEDQLRLFLVAQGYAVDQITRAVGKLRSDASLGGGRNLYQANKDIYERLRYGVEVKTGVGEDTKTIDLIDWENPHNNHFGIAEEVTVHGRNTKRPDVVLYVNGIAFVTLELKRSVVFVSDGIRQTIANQRPDFIEQFFTTVQLVLAGNDTEGLRYSVIGTKEKYWLRWKEPTEEAGVLDADLAALCSKDRLLEIVHDFIVFDAGQKKTARHNQYFAVKAAQERIRRREGGIIWHTQGSGKSLIMVWLAKWILENNAAARVLILTDRTELDDQLKNRVFKGVGEDIYRTKSGADLLGKLNTTTERLICSLIHKFRPGMASAAQPEESDNDEFVAELQSAIPAGFSAKGDLFVFIDEAHRTQSGKLHDAMARLLPGAIFIGFTGTPLLKADKSTSVERFGTYIHTYKFDEAVADGVVLDLRYEPRNIEQDLTSQQRVDQWFDAKTRGMTALSKAKLKERWGTMQRVFSSRKRTEQIVDDILFDMETKPRLMDGTGNALLVSQSIYQACTFYELFNRTDLKGKCAIITSYQPSASDVALEDSGEGATEKLRQYGIYRQMLGDFFSEPLESAVNKVEEFEEKVKARFLDEPGQMRLLIVVDKLLTGFDAPSATYLYIDKPMKDHGLFQAICRVNRLDGDDKEYGYVVDYRDLFKSLKSAVHDYTVGAFEGYESEDVEGLLKDRLSRAKQDLDDAREVAHALCEVVEPPKGIDDYRRYFCAVEAGNMAQLNANEPKRVGLYKAVARLARTYAEIANEMVEAGYTEIEATKILAEVKHYVAVRTEVRLAAGENVDLKQYEAGMRHLLDTYISAKESEVLMDFGENTLIDLIVKQGASAIDSLPQRTRASRAAVAETVVNNVRRVIVDDRALNPKYYDRMSQLLDELIDQHKTEVLEYQAYLARLIELAGQIGREDSNSNYPTWATNGGQRAVYDLLQDSDTAEAVDRTVMNTKRDSWVGDSMKERMLAIELRRTLEQHNAADRFDDVFELLKMRSEYR